MITTIFVIIMLAVLLELICLAIKAAWSITKVVFTIIFWPLILIAMVLAGTAYIALPVLVIVGVVALVKRIA